VKASGFGHVYGPVPSRRLGRSLGIDLVPFKTCTFDCVYCQLGRTTKKTIQRKEYVSIERILIELKRKLVTANIPDYISLAGSGEPTLNSGIGELIVKIKEMTDIPLAVLTNGSLLWKREIQDALLAADLVLPSLDAGDQNLFRTVNRPKRNLWFALMVDGIASFTRRFKGEVWLEVFLLAGVTGMQPEVEKIAALVKRIGPARTQLNTVARPPTEEFAFPLSADQMLALKGFFPGRVEIISENEGKNARTPTFNETTDVDILALLNRRPCTNRDVATGLGIHVVEALKHLERLNTDGRVRIVATGGHVFYTINQLQGNKK
jgi:wyosine [tRNA(Phe)-imidazoG37] synthetase (radical SAM superfamily)